MQPTKTTVYALLNVLKGRDPNEVIIIENNQLKIVETVNLLKPQLPLGIINAETKTNSVLRDTANQVVRAEVSPESIANRTVDLYRPWSQDELMDMAEWRAKGASFYDIGKAFGRTSRAVEAKLHYMANPA